MNTNHKTVLLFQPSDFQAEVWRFLLWEQDIFVIWNENYTNQPELANYFKTLTLKPDLLIIDLTIDNAYELCRSFRNYYPSSKIILTTDPQQAYSAVIRRWAAKQGVDELLINFQKDDLYSNAITNINYVLKILDSPPVEQENIVKALEFLKPENTFRSHPEANELLSDNTVTKNSEKTTSKTISSLVRLGLFFAMFFIVALILDAGIWHISFSVQRMQTKDLAYSEEPKDTEQIDNPPPAITSTNPITLKEVNDIPQGIYNYGGSTTWAPIREIINPEIAQEHPEFNIRYVPAINGTPGSGTGIRMLLDGQLDFSQSSRSIKPEEYTIARHKGYTIREYNVAIDAIAIAVHPSLNVPGLTTEQLKKIYLGKITNWKQVNGPDLEIVPLTRRETDGGTPEFFQNQVLEKKHFGHNVKYVYSTTDGLKQLIQTPGGIYYASAPEIVPQCAVKSLPLAREKEEFIPPYLPPLVPRENCPQQRNKLNISAIKDASYPITRYLSVIVKQDGGRAQQGGEAFTKLLLTKDMQDLIEEAGFVPIY